MCDVDVEPSTNELCLAAFRAPEAAFALVWLFEASPEHSRLITHTEAPESDGRVDVSRLVNMTIQGTGFVISNSLRRPTVALTLSQCTVLSGFGFMCLNLVPCQFPLTTLSNQNGSQLPNNAG